MDEKVEKEILLRLLMRRRRKRRLEKVQKRAKYRPVLGKISIEKTTRAWRVQSPGTRIAE